MTEKKYSLGIDFVLDIIDGKWKKYVIFALGLSSQRYGQLLRFINQQTGKRLSRKVLTDQLNQLIELKIVTKQAYNTTPPKTIYSLTKAGQQMRFLMLQISVFGEKFAHTLESSDFKIDITWPSSSYLSETEKKQLNAH